MQVLHCEFPDDLYYDVENDVWLKENADVLTIGITSVLSFLAGRIRKVDLKEEKRKVLPSQSVATIESQKYFGAIRSPLKALISRTNLELKVQPRKLNDMPYGDGWVAKLEDYDRTELSKLLKGREATKNLEVRIQELKVNCFKKLPDEQLVSIGIECFSTLANLNEIFEENPVGTVVHLISDDPFAEIEMIKWADQTGNEILETRFEGKLSHFLVEKR